MRISGVCVCVCGGGGGGVRFDHISVLTLRIRTERSEQTVDPDQMPQNAASD